jgi:hypothetical protein
MKIIYHFYTEALTDDCEGMFDEKGKMLDCWSCRDARWQNEFFDYFLEKLGIEVLPLPKKYSKKALDQIRENFGQDWRY